MVPARSAPASRPLSSEVSRNRFSDSAKLTFGLQESNSQAAVPVRHPSA
jgi:hypothetical protein